MARRMECDERSGGKIPLPFTQLAMSHLRLLSFEIASSSPSQVMRVHSLRTRRAVAHDDRRSVVVDFPRGGARRREGEGRGTKGEGSNQLRKCFLTTYVLGADLRLSHWHLVDVHRRGSKSDVQDSTVASSSSPPTCPTYVVIKSEPPGASKEEERRRASNVVSDEVRSEVSSRFLPGRCPRLNTISCTASTSTPSTWDISTWERWWSLTRENCSSWS